MYSNVIPGNIFGKNSWETIPGKRFLETIPFGNKSLGIHPNQINYMTEYRFSSMVEISNIRWQVKMKIKSEKAHEAVDEAELELGLLIFPMAILVGKNF